MSICRKIARGNFILALFLGALVFAFWGEASVLLSLAAFTAMLAGSLSLAFFALSLGESSSLSHDPSGS